MTTPLIFVYIIICAKAIFAAEDTYVTINKVRKWTRFSTGYVRCFCNLPTCVSTGYMCKSSSGGCFSNFFDSPDYKSLHGCLELLTNKNQTSLCDENAKKESVLKFDSKSIIHCCYHDMCNHIDSPQTKNLLNNTLDEKKFVINQQTMNGYTESEVWFRAATIAVPICGAIILFLLIALAIKILRSENQSSSNRKLSLYNQPSESKHCDKFPEYDNCLRKSQLYEQERIQVPLLVQNEIVNKNETNAKLNLMHCDNQYSLGQGKSIILEIEKEVSNPNINYTENNQFIEDNKSYKKNQPLT